MRDLHLVAWIERAVGGLEITAFSVVHMYWRHHFRRGQILHRPEIQKALA